ncbi:MAG: KTSC domain-containing protein [Kiritimatiellae bacterium]|nr:KTSC domain-containing protein [Kiritimatiellia bacterium]
MAAAWAVASVAVAWPGGGNKAAARAAEQAAAAWAAGKDAPVDDSELIGRVGYDAEKEELRVQMAHSSDWYIYKGVPAAVAQGLWESKSKGGYFGAHVKGRYPFVRVEEE